jgi:hypothetical protein
MYAAGVSSMTYFPCPAQGAGCFSLFRKRPKFPALFQCITASHAYVLRYCAVS